MSKTVAGDGDKPGSAIIATDMAENLEAYLFRQLQAIFEFSSDGLWLCDGEGRIRIVNKAAEKLNGIKAQEVVGKYIYEVVRQDQGIIGRSVTMQVLETKRQVSELQYVKETGKYLLATGTPVFDENGNISLVVCNDRDMTYLNELKEQLEHTRLIKEKYERELAELSMLEIKKGEIIAESPAMREVCRTVLKLAHLDSFSLLILGESGTGKGLVAKFIHQKSNRSNKAFIQINCAALPESLLEAELFGYEKGAFTGAKNQGKLGLLEIAHGGTLFLDEIGDAPLSIQAKLLKYLDDHEVLRLGGTRSKTIDCAIIAASNRDLKTLVQQGTFRRDLFYRLNTFTIRIPPLRERREDIFALAKHFLDKYNGKYKMNKRLSPLALQWLYSYSFPGNVRELENIVKSSLIMSEGDILEDYILAALKGEVKKSIEFSLADELRAREMEVLKLAIQRCKTTRDMASYLGISQPTIVRKLKMHGLSVRSIQ
jgi:PAS domain S-box-containing protein